MSFGFRITSSADRVQGWSYLWCKEVRGFNPAVHCAKCLIGKYENRFGQKSPVNEDIDLDGYEPGAILYFCGVSRPYRWMNNAHLAVRVTGDAADVVTIGFYTGDALTVYGAQGIPFNDTSARAQYGDRSSAYLTCRNFQFGAAIASSFACEAG